MKLRILALAVALSVGLVACGGTATDVATQEPAAVVQVVDRFAPAEAAAYLTNNPEAVILDVRTPEEFAEGHLEGALNIDFYAADFRDTLATLEPGADYVVYCRSGNRSGQTTAMMEELGFSSVHDVTGGIVAWTEDRVPLSGF